MGFKVNAAGELQDSNGGPAKLKGQSAAKAWTHYDQTAPSLTDSFNISSLTDSSTGIAVSNFTSSLSNDTFGVALGMDGTGVGATHPPMSNPSRGTSASGVGIVTPNSSNANTDYRFVYGTVHGDLA